MTKKQYEKKIRQVQRNLAKYSKENGFRPLKTADRIQIPHWGTVIVWGKHQGEILRTYQQAWDMVSETLRGTPAMEGIE